MWAVLNANFFRSAAFLYKTLGARILLVAWNQFGVAVGGWSVRLIAFVSKMVNKSAFTLSCLYQCACQMKDLMLATSECRICRKMLDRRDQTFITFCRDDDIQILSFSIFFTLGMSSGFC